MTAASLQQASVATFMSEPHWQSSAPSESNPTAAGEEEHSVDAESVRLMLRVKDGDVRAFEKLVELHQNIVIGTVTRMLGNVEDAHDIAQQTFLRVWKSAPRYEPTAKFTTWLFTIARNLVFNESRRRTRRKEVSIDADVEDESPRQFADHAAPGADHLVQQEELEFALDKAIAALPEKQRLAVILRRHQELPYEQICDILKMTLPAVKSLLFRARTELRKQLASYLGEDIPA